MIAGQKVFFRGTLANFCKSKKFIISNVDYHPGSKKSKFTMTLISDSPLKPQGQLISKLQNEQLFSTLKLESCYD